MLVRLEDLTNKRELQIKIIKLRNSPVGQDIFTQDDVDYFNILKDEQPLDQLVTPKDNNFTVNVDYVSTNRKQEILGWLHVKYVIDNRGFWQASGVYTFALSGRSSLTFARDLRRFYDEIFKKCATVQMVRIVDPTYPNSTIDNRNHAQTIQYHKKPAENDAKTEKHILERYNGTIGRQFEGVSLSGVTHTFEMWLFVTPLGIANNYSIKNGD